MFIVPYSPFKDLDNFFKDWETGLSPKVDYACDVYEKGKNVIAEMEIPGMDPKNIKVSIEGNVLKVEGKEESKEEEKEKGYYRKEIRKGSFKRLIALPEDIDFDKAESVYENGVLKVTIPKKEEKKKEVKSKEIKIKTKKSKK